MYNATNLYNLTNATDFYSFTSSVNDITGNWWALVILFLLYLVILTGTLNWGKKTAFGVSSFVGILGGMVLWYSGFITNYSFIYVAIIGVMLAIGAMMIFPDD